MSTNVIPLEQVCKEIAGPHGEAELSIQQSVPTTLLSSAVSTRLKNISNQLAPVLTQSLSLEDMLSSLAAMIVQAMGMDLCAFLLLNQDIGYLTLYACVPDLSDKKLDVQPVSVSDEVWNSLCESMMRGESPGLTVQMLDALNPLRNVQYETLLPIPLSVGTECIGMLHCYSHKTIDYVHHDLQLLNTMAGQIALATKLRQSIEPGMLGQKNILHAFLDDLLADKPGLEESLRRRAHMLNCDLTKPHTVVVIEIVPSGNVFTNKTEASTLYKNVVQSVKDSITKRYPGSLIDQRNSQLMCLLCLGDDPNVEHAATWLDNLACQVERELHASLAIGVGDVCSTISTYRTAYAKAIEALEIGQCFKHEKGCTLFHTLGIYRYVYAFARTNPPSDHYQQQITAIAEYDQRKNSSLLDTLETYLECGCSIATTASLLDIHRNTLLQRLSRLQSLCTINLEQYAHWMALLAALKVYRLQTHSI